MAGDKVKSKKSAKQQVEKATAAETSTKAKIAEKPKESGKKTAPAAEKPSEAALVTDVKPKSTASGKPAKKSAKKSAKTKSSESATPQAAASVSSNEAASAPIGSIASALTSSAAVDTSVSALFTVTSAVPVAPPVFAPLLETQAADDKEDGKKKTGKKRKAPEEGEEDKEEGSEKKPKGDIDPLRQRRTLFVGNVPLKMKKDTVKRIFKDYGKIESVRFRSVAIADPKVPKKVGFITKDFHPGRSSMNAYVVFDTEENAKAALAANGSLVEGNHIVCDLASNTEHDTKHTVFVGGLPFDVENEAVWEIFSQCGEVANVRVVRDRKTNFGKGIAYVRFKDAAGVGLAERLNGTDLNGRQIRVSRALDKKTLERKSSKKQQPSFQGTKAKTTGAARRVMAAKLSKPKKGKSSGGVHKPAKKSKPSDAKLQKRIESKKKKLSSKKA